MVMIRDWTVDLQTRQELLELQPISFLKKTYIVQHFSLGNLAAKQQISVGYFNLQGMAGFILPWIGEKDSWLNTASEAATENMALEKLSTKCGRNE